MAFSFPVTTPKMAHTLLEVNASQKDKDYILAINWKKIEELVAAGKGTDKACTYYHNKFDDKTHSAASEILKSVKTLSPEDVKGAMFYIPCPKSPHGADVDPTGEYIVGGKLASVIPVFSFTKMKKAIDGNDFEGNVEGILKIKV